MVAIAGEEPMQEPGGHGDRIFVSVRLRPLNEKETSRNDVSDWECINDTTIIYRNNLSLSERSMYPTAYSFDRVFGTDCSTKRVYEEGAKSVALSVVSGINSSIFAYGQTSSGKTYTMSGITGYTVADIFDYIEKHTEREFNLKFSAMEIYNESVRDLLSADATPLRLLDDPERGTIVERLTEENLRNWEHFNELLSVCEAERQIGETALNEASSRSHQILRLVIESSAREFLGYDKSSSLSAVVNFIDLAGSERASQTLSAGTRLKEGCHINRSLLTLGTVIRKLSKGRNGHVPYRDSKLTRILQSSLGGNARTAIICTMSPAHSHVEQSRNTLLFASCAKEVSTNAQVNVVMSDKALVKHLKKELNRLENELRGSGPRVVPADSCTLLREKDLQIEKLKKEVSELVLQRDLAQSQVKDLVRVLGDDKPSAADLDRYYPKLRVRNTWDIETQTLGAPVLAASDGRTNSVRSFSTSLYSDGDSRTSSEETLLQLPDFEENFLHTDSRQFSVDIPNFVDNNLHQEESKEQSDGNSEDLCKEVRCIEMEESRRNRYMVSNESDSSASRYQNSNISSPAANTATSGLTVVENGVSKNQERESPLLNRRGFVFPTSEKIPLWLPEKEMLSPLLFKLRRSRSSKARLMTSSPPCFFEMVEKYESTPTVEFEKGFIGRPDGFQKKLPALNYGAEIERLSNGSQASERIAAADECKALEAKSTDDECKPQETKSTNVQCKPQETKSTNNECPALDIKSTNDECQAQETKSTNEECQAQETKSTNEECQAQETISTNVKCQSQETKSTNDECQGQEPKSTTERSSFVEETEEMADTQFNQLADSMVPEADLKPIPFARDVKDVGLDPIPMDEESPSRWSSEFNKLQGEIIELWDTCNVSLVHRTYFFLLFKGDPSDSIYMEVELRRLSFLKDTFSRGNQTLEDGETLTPASSLKALTSERHMLSKQMKRRLSEDERNNLYLKWGISLHSKHRRLQLANLLWSDRRNMDHIMDSATVVSKLVSKVEPEQAFKEMFGLRFAPRDSLARRKSHFWSDGFKSLV